MRTPGDSPRVSELTNVTVFLKQMSRLGLYRQCLKGNEENIFLRTLPFSI